MKIEKRAQIIKNWINDYCDKESFSPESLIVGISGGIDSSVVSALCALTGKKTIAVSMPIKQIKSQHDLSLKHGDWLKSKFKNIEFKLIEMEKIFNSFKETLSDFDNEHGLANSIDRRLVQLQ